MQDRKGYEPAGFQESANRVIRQNATIKMTVFTAWEFSHWRRSTSQLSGTIVQFCVAELAGWVQTKKMTSVATKQSAAATANQNGHFCDRTANARPA
jgi:hypothetical protein